MKPAYERLELRITPFDREDAITTSDMPGEESTAKRELENVYQNFRSFRGGSSWF